MFREFTIPHDTFDNDRFKKIKLSSKYLYCYLAKLKNHYENPDGWFWHSMKELSHKMKINMKTLKKAKKELLLNGFIEVKRGKYIDSNKRSADCYRVLGFRDHPAKAPNMD